MKSLSFTDVGKSWPSHMANMSFNVIRQNKILAKIFKFTVNTKYSMDIGMVALEFIFTF